MTAWRTLRVRLTLWYCLVLMAAIGAFGGVVYGVVRYQLLRHHDGALRNASRRVEAIVELHEDCAQLTDEQVEELDRIGMLVLVHDVGGSGHICYRSPDAVAGPIPFVLEAEPKVMSRPAWFSTVHDQSGGLVRVYSVPYRSRAGRQGMIHTAERLGDVEEPLHALELTLLIALPGALLVASAGGYWLARRALAPVDRVTRLAREIGASDLGRRLPEPLVQDEVGRLVETLNQMIARLEASFATMQRFTGDASHELRSPLANLRAILDVALARPRDAAEHEAVLRSLGEEVDRLRDIVDDLLVLARADAGRVEMRRGPVRLDLLAAETVEALEPAASRRGVILHARSHEGVTVLGDERWLRQLLANLLDNAIKAAAAGTRREVSVEVEMYRDSAAIAVVDTGPGIPENALPHVFERFFRAESARTPGEGTGLGLAIASWIAAAHGGSITAACPPSGGTRLTVNLPLAA